MDVYDSTPVRLGTFLVESGSLTQEQLEDALLEQRVTRKRLGAILVSHGIISAPELTAGLVAQIGGERGSAEAIRIEPAGRVRSTSRDGRRSGAARVFRPRRRRARAAAEAELRELHSAAEAHLSVLTRRCELAGRELEQARLELDARNARIAALESHLQSSERERARLIEALRGEIQLQEAALHAVQRLESTVGNGKPHAGPVLPAA